RFIRTGLADAAVVGGCDSRCALTLNGFHSLSALSRSGCKPFSANRDGTVIGEGAAIFLMSREPVGPTLAGVGESSDAHNMTAPDPDGRGAVIAMTRALEEVGIDGKDLSYVNLHGTGTTLNDAMESRALENVVGDEVPCSSSKGQIGHTLGAAGAVEAAICWLTLQHNPGGKFPPHLWDGDPAEDAPLPGMVKKEDRLPAGTNHYLMSNSYAFGGSNISVVLGSGNDR
ncbi:MAG: beta-ketoacyl synthase N-terminal-like domain-containing protein, partial [Gammaproteobacteria bacterium]|nr:beta-ketoacyl synthase N-terminal-like domain-containing protein [Gammaproteobacteria bacterium]